MKVALICDNGRIAVWQARALATAGVTHVALVLDCRNTHTVRDVRRHAAYYALNLLAIRSAETRSLTLAEAGITADQTLPFDAETQGAWQSLPAAVIDRVRAVAPDAIVKFGMGLLRVPPREVLAAPILSYHHGDPAHFRGRPAGFWELAGGTPVLGQVVQALGDRLDGGAILARAETKVHPHSYRATMVEAYRHSALLLGPALHNAAVQRALSATTLGPNHRLPSNGAVIATVARMARKWLGRLAYGAFWEKSWRVSLAPRPADPLAPPATLAALGGRGLPVPAGYTFLADPFLLTDGDVLAEGLHARSGLGQIVRIARDGGVRVLMAGGGHASYPSLVEAPSGPAMLPETARWAAPALYPVGAPGSGTPLAIEGEPRLLDPTWFAADGHHYLFANDRAHGAHALMLWVADAVTGPYRLHSASPIRISPRGGRMGGAILETGGRRYRLGQDGARGYGERLIAFEILRLSRDEYEEREAGEIAFTDVRGPHTLNMNADQIVLDHYVERFAPLAGVRRAMARLRA